MHRYSSKHVSGGSLSGIAYVLRPVPEQTCQPPATTRVTGEAPPISTCFDSRRFSLISRANETMWAEMQRHAGTRHDSSNRKPLEKFCGNMQALAVWLLHSAAFQTRPMLGSKPFWLATLFQLWGKRKGSCLWHPCGHGRLVNVINQLLSQIPPCLADGRLKCQMNAQTRELNGSRASPTTCLLRTHVGPVPRKVSSMPRDF